ncbi:hypothetical protein FPQ18DRAFT_401993 [Pyronema domesticum]|uniref:Similar to Probable dipeptidyl-aminopeptidase B acc. no. D5GM60 n=1 Tax=Pyronema omphalodes (strain CBS 100304) TaxID=1076935 RepID=U4LEM5_PYROM|nr:hypothetical protein FPQ18DRAFT_401993 [Pyronema domesticum]CCX09729.1 Similar to Probable dipeptidyl-aminopeptidase B; acc. no. D5GM60 [Pyronema omphalodes CBS 100304]
MAGVSRVPSAQDVGVYKTKMYGGLSETEVAASTCLLLVSYLSLPFFTGDSWAHRYHGFKKLPNDVDLDAKDPVLITKDWPITNTTQDGFYDVSYSKGGICFAHLRRAFGPGIPGQKVIDASVCPPLTLPSSSIKEIEDNLKDLKGLSTRYSIPTSHYNLQHHQH